ncbi:hypothetical protein EC5412_1758, partial [Escherichia coli 5412]
GSAGDSCLLHS